jgi:hypothetical protein
MRLAPAVESRRSSIPWLIALVVVLAIPIKIAYTVLSEPSTELLIEDRAHSYVHWAAGVWSLDSPGHVACPPVPHLLLEREHRLDPWGREPRYLCEPMRLHRVFVISAGEDGVFGTADDVSSR